jgi:acyl-CoA oxidase
MRGISIAEGDVLVLCIRMHIFYTSFLAHILLGLASELLMQKYDVPGSSDPTSLLARHEAGLFAEFRELCRVNGGNRSTYFANQIIPQCVVLVEAIGHRFAFDAAVSAGLPTEMIAVYECAAVKLDLAWYVENSVFTRAEFRQMEDAAILNAHSHIDSWVNAFNVEHCLTAPITSAASWESFVASLPVFTDISRSMPRAKL